MRDEYSSSGIHLYTHTQHHNEWLTDLSTHFFFLLHFLFFFIVPDHEAQPWLLIQSIKHNKKMDDKNSSPYPLLLSKSNKYVFLFTYYFFFFQLILWFVLSELILRECNWYFFIENFSFRLYLLYLFYIRPSILHRKNRCQPCLLAYHCKKKRRDIDTELAPCNENKWILNKEKRLKSFILTSCLLFSSLHLSY
jgi:hypothetical protein